MKWKEMGRNEEKKLKEKNTKNGKKRDDTERNRKKHEESG